MEEAILIGAVHRFLLTAVHIISKKVSLIILSCTEFPSAIARFVSAAIVSDFEYNAGLLQYWLHFQRRAHNREP